MPNIIFKPRPMVDPYAGKAGELIGELFQTIGQIYLLRQQRNQTNAVLNIMKTPTITEDEKLMGVPGLTENDKRAEIINISRTGGDFFKNIVARQLLSDLLIPEYEKKWREQRLKTEEAREAHLKRTEGLDLNDLIKTYEILNEWKVEYEPWEEDSPEIAKQKADNLAEIDAILQQVKSAISQRVSRNNITKTSAPINKKAEVQPTAKTTATQPKGIAQRVKQGMVMPALGSQRLAGFSQGPFGTIAQNMTEALKQKSGALSNIRTPAIATTMYGLDTTALGVPSLQINTPEELDKLPSGSFFIAPDGTLRRKK